MKTQERNDTVKKLCGLGRYGLWLGITEDKHTRGLLLMIKKEE